MGRSISGALVVIQMIWVIICVAPFAQADVRVQSVGTEDLSFLTTDGRTVSLRDFEGAYVLLHFFASWCGECIIEAPSLEALSRTLPPEAMVVVGVAINDEIESARTFVKRQRLSFPVIVDVEGHLKRRFSVRGVPLTVMLDRRGALTSFSDPVNGSTVSRLAGPRQWDSPAALAMIRRILGRDS